MPIEYNYTMVPSFTLYGDGRIIVPGPFTMQYPGAALPNLQTTVVSEDVIQAMLAAAKEAGLFQNGVDYGQPGVADVGTTTITVNAGGATYTSQIYALGFEDGGNMTMQQQQARAAINDLQSKLSDPSTSRPETAGLGVLRFHGSPGVQPELPAAADTTSTDIQPNHLPWPLADLATSGEEVANAQGLRKVVVSGDDLETLKPLLKQATEITSGAERNASTTCGSGLSCRTRRPASEAHLPGKRRPAPGARHRPRSARYPRLSGRPAFGRAPAAW